MRPFSVPAVASSSRVTLTSTCSFSTSRLTPRGPTGSHRTDTRAFLFADEDEPLPESIGHTKNLGWHRNKMLHAREQSLKRQDQLYKKLVGDRISPYEEEQIQMLAKNPKGKTPSDFRPVGFGLEDREDKRMEMAKRRNPKAPPKVKNLAENKVVHRFKEGGFQDDFYHDPFLDTSVADSVDMLRVVLYPSRMPDGSIPPADPQKVLEACQRFVPRNKEGPKSLDHPRVVALDPYIDDIFDVLTAHFSEAPLPLPVVQTEVVETLERGLLRAARDRRPQCDRLSGQYAKVVLHQTMLSTHDTNRLHNLLNLVDRLLSTYSQLALFHIPVPLVASLAVLTEYSGSPKASRRNYRFIWPKPELVQDYLSQHAISIEPSTVTKIYDTRRLEDLPDNMQSLDAKLSLTRRVDDFVSIWRHYRDLYNYTTAMEPKKPPVLDAANRQEVIATFYNSLMRRMAFRPFEETEGPVTLKQLRSEITTQLERPFHRLALQGMAYAQTRPDPDVLGIESDETAGDGVETRARALEKLWKIANDPVHERDTTFYGLYVTALGYCRRPREILEAWNSCVADETCRRRFQQEHPNDAWPPVQVFNRVLAALTRIPGEGVDSASKLFDQALQPDSPIQIDHYTIATMLRYRASQGDVAEMQNLVEMASQHGITANAVIYGTLIQGFVKASRLDKIEATLKLMVEQGIEPGKRLFPVLVSGLCRSGDMHQLREAERLFQSAESHGITLDVHSWAALAGGYFRGGWSEDGWDVMRRMAEAGVKMNRVAYDLVLQELGKQIERSDESGFTSVSLLKRMLSERLYPGYKTWETALLPLVKSRQWAAAQDVVELMKQTRSAPKTQLLRKLLHNVQWQRAWKEEPLRRW